MLCPYHSTQAQPAPEFIRYTFTGENFFLAFDPITNQWMRVGVSSDLNSWTELVNIITTNDYSPAIYVDDSANAASRRFYRASAPGTTVEQARTLWESQNLDSYRFHLKHTSFSRALVFTGTITVTNGAKTVVEVTVSGEPTTEFDPDDFPTVEELFDLLDEAANPGVRLAWTQYDTNWGFPLRCHFDNRSSSSKHFSQYEVSEVGSLEP